MTRAESLPDNSSPAAPQKGMPLPTSLYLDLVRFAAAFVVFLGHFSSERLSGGLFWELQPYGHVSVIAFFVLSGLVISYATDQKDRTLRSYSLSRLSRLYSVVAPAILVTLIADAIGTRLSPQLYSSDWGYADSYPLLRVMSALTFTTNIWFINVQPFSNGAFWSLPFEFWYYVLFGVVYFMRGKRRWVWALIVVAIAGPRILFLLPVWLMGVAAYRIMTTAKANAITGWTLFVVSLLIFALMRVTNIPALEAHMPDALLPAAFKAYCCGDAWAPFGTAYDYIYGLLFAANFVGFRFIGETFRPLLVPFKRQIRWLAGLTFSLYLLHMPLLQAFAAASPLSHSSLVHQVLLLVAVFATAVALAYVTELRRADLHAWLGQIIPEPGRAPVLRGALTGQTATGDHP